MFGLSFMSGRSFKSVASITKILSTPAGSDLPCVANHVSPRNLAFKVGSLSGPFPADDERKMRN
jgi:hypothetical protein